MKITKEEKKFIRIINDEMIEKVNLYNEHVGKSIPKGNIQTGNELIYMISRGDSQDNYMEFYNKHKCWPDKIPPSIIVNSIIGYSRNFKKSYNLIFVENKTVIEKSLLLSAMELAEMYNRKLKLSWSYSPIVSGNAYENMPEYVDPNDYLPKIELEKYYSKDYTPDYYILNFN